MINICCSNICRNDAYHADRSVSPSARRKRRRRRSHEHDPGPQPTHQHSSHSGDYAHEPKQSRRDKSTTKDRSSRKDRTDKSDRHEGRARSKDDTKSRIRHRQPEDTRLVNEIHNGYSSREHDGDSASVNEGHATEMIESRGRWGDERGG